MTHVSSRLNATRKADRRKFILGSAFLFIAALSQSALAAPKDNPLPAVVTNAKTVFLDNQTGTEAVLETARKEFTTWGRFKIVDSKTDADLVVIFSHKNGMDLVGNTGFIQMEVFTKGSITSVFKVKKSFRNIFQPQLRTKNCVVDFERRLEGKN